MQDIVIESIRAVVLMGLLVFLWRAGKDRFEHTREGWNLVLGGFGLLLFGSLIDITDNFEALNRFVIIGDTDAQAILEKFVGFLGGFLVLAIGLFQWIPSVQRLTTEINEREQAEAALAQTHAELEGYAEELNQALQKEKELGSLQRQFVSMVSHEFRTPLAIIDGNAQRLQRRKGEAVPERSMLALGKIRNSVQQLTELMESVLAAARLEDGRINFVPGPCSLANIIEEVGMSYGELYPDHELALDLSRLPKQFAADGKLLRQVFSNVISNAVKYSPGTAQIWIDGWEDDNGDAIVTVRDEGVGIPAAEQARLFERFFRASTSTGIAGSGIGLHLASHLVRLHHGTIDFESAEGQGTTFKVRLPATRDTVPETEPTQSEIDGAVTTTVSTSILETAA
ncbi:MAG: sensor histidine kinase [Geminicoccaceae bacterium]